MNETRKTCYFIKFVLEGRASYLTIFGKHIDTSETIVLCEADLHSVRIADLFRNKRDTYIVHTNNFFWLSFWLKQKIGLTSTHAQVYYVLHAYM